MDKQIKQKAKRIFAAMLALTITAGTLPYTPLSGVVGDVAVTADAADAVTYIGADGTTQTITDYTLVTDSNSKVTWEAGNYVVLGDVTISVTESDAISSDGTVNLILCDNAHLTVTSTGSSKSAIEISEELNIFAQSTGSDKGKLTAQGDYGADCKCLNVYGGEVTLNGESRGLNIKNYDVSTGLTVNGGDVTITCSNAYEGTIFYGHNAHNGHVTVNGGSLNVSSSASDYNQGIRKYQFSSF